MSGYRRNTITHGGGGTHTVVAAPRIGGTSAGRSVTSTRPGTPRPVQVRVSSGTAKLVLLGPTGARVGRVVHDPPPGLFTLPAGATVAHALKYDGTTTKLVGVGDDQASPGRGPAAATGAVYAWPPAGAGPSGTRPETSSSSLVQVWAHCAVPSTTAARDPQGTPLPLVPPHTGATWKVPVGLALATDDLLSISSMTVKPEGATHWLVDVQAGARSVQVYVRSASAEAQTAPAPTPPSLPPPPPPSAPSSSPPPAAAATKNRRRAVVVGVSAYRLINGLEYADDDAVSWTKYLQSRGYEVRLLGDGKSDYSPFQPFDVATEHNVRASMAWLSQASAPGDRAAIVTSGHGGGDGKGASWVCCVDETGQAPHGIAEDGSYTDAEMCADATKIIEAGATLFMFLDNCYSGGALDDMQAGLPASQFFLCSTCSDHGYGFDEPRWHHGAWTHCFLIRTLDGDMAAETFPTLGRVFDAALKLYPYANDPANRPVSGGNRSLTL